MNTLIGSIPKHQYIWVDSGFTHKNPIGFVRAVWFGLVSFPGRAWGLNIMFESGAVYRSLPPHAVSFSENQRQKNWKSDDAQLWDCYGQDWTCVEYTYLKGLQCSCKIKDNLIDGEYLFTVAPINDGFSNAPEQSKEFKFIKLDNGRLTIQPTNRVLFQDKSFTDKNISVGLKLQTEYYTCE